MESSDILTELTIKVYEPPLSLLRDDGRITNLADPVAVLMLVIDFETELSMNGINDYIGNSTGLYARETVEALKVLGCLDAAQKLSEILDQATGAGMTHGAIQRDRSGLTPYTITTFNKLHGDKWSQVSEAINELADDIDFSIVWDCAEKFIDERRDTFVAALKRKGNA